MWHLQSEAEVPRFSLLGGGFLNDGSGDGKVRPIGFYWAPWAPLPREARRLQG